MRVLITGCSRFLGEAIARALTAHGHEPIATASRAREGVAALDVCDAAAVDAHVAHADTVIHLAAIRAYGTADQTARASRVIEHGTATVVRAARAQGIPVVIAGSGEEYGAGAPVPYREDGVYAPTSAYGQAKRASVIHALREYPEGASVLRPSTVYGPAQPAMMLVAQCASAAARDEVVRIHGGAQTRDHVFVDDAAEAFARAVERARLIVGHEINIASGHAPTVRAIAEQILALAQRGRLEVGPASTRAGDVMEASFDVTRAQTLLDWRARTSLDAGLALTVREALARE